MSVYRCNRCENIFDADTQGIEEDPNDDTQCLCENCYEDVTETIREKEFNYHYSQYKKSRRQ